MAQAEGGGSSYRWAILAAGTLAQTGYTTLFAGLAVLAPSLRARYGLSLADVGLVLAAPSVGSITTLYPWGLAADRFGERAVIGTGLGIASACVAGAAFVSSFAGLVVLLAFAGALGAGVNSASGRAVMHWFDAASRGFALGVRQTAVPIAGALTAFGLPLLSSHDDPRRGLLALAAAFVVGAAVAATVLREGPVPEADEHRPAAPTPLRNPQIWRLATAGSLLVQPQTCLIGFLVVFLHAHRGMTTSAAATTLAVLNLLGIATRIGAGRWSDRERSRIRPLRRIALGSATLVACSAALVSGPLVLLVPVVVLMGCVTLSWNSLAFAATAEAAGHARSGTALGLQQTLLAVSASVLPVAFGAAVAASSWTVGFALSALFPIAGWRLLRGMPG